MLSPADMLVVGVAALLFFGPDQLPKVARRAGQVVREVQATSASFIHEMERAADEPDHRTPYVPPEPYAQDPPIVTIDHPAPAETNHAPHGAPDVTPPIAPDLAPHAAFDYDSHAATNPAPPAKIEHTLHDPADHPEPPLSSNTKSGSTEVKPPNPKPQGSTATN